MLTKSLTIRDYINDDIEQPQLGTLAMVEQQEDKVTII